MTTGNLNAVRVSTHMYNNADEVDMLLEFRPAAYCLSYTVVLFTVRP